MEQDFMKDPSEMAWKLLSNSIGNYFGTGLNHEGEKYEGRCSLICEASDKLISFKSEAKGFTGQVFHEEQSWIGRDISGVLTLYVSSNNHPGVTPHVFHRIEEAQDGSKKVVFRFGNPVDSMSFREEVTFAVHSNYNIEHTYAWGLPGGMFETRSSARMKKMI